MSGVKLLDSIREEEIAQEGLISRIKEKIKKRKLQRELEKQKVEEEKKRLAEMEAEKRKEEEAKIIEAHKYRIKDRQKLIKLAKPILDKYEKKYNKTIFSDIDSFYDELFEQGFYAYFKIGNWDAWNYDPAIRGNAKKLEEAYVILEDCVDEINKVLPKKYRCEYDGDWDTAMIYIIEMNGAFESVVMSIDEFEIPDTESIEIDKYGLEYVVATESEIFGIDWRGNRLDIAEEGWFKNMKEKAEARRQRRRDESYAKEIDPNHKQTKEPLKLSDVYVEEIRYNTNRKALQSKYPNCKIPRAFRDKETVIVLFIDKESGKHVGDMTIDKRKNGTIWLEDLMIKSNFQGRGFSKEAVKLAVTKYDVAYLETFKEGKVAHATYLKCGFKDVPESHPLYEEVVDVMEYTPNANKQRKATEGVELKMEKYGVLESILHDEEIAEEGIFSSIKDMIKNKWKKLKEENDRLLAERRKKYTKVEAKAPEPTPEDEAYHEEVKNYALKVIKQVANKYPKIKKLLDIDEFEEYDWSCSILVYDYDDYFSDLEDSDLSNDEVNKIIGETVDNSNAAVDEMIKEIKSKYPDIKASNVGLAYAMIDIEFPIKESNAVESILDYILSDEY